MYKTMQHLNDEHMQLYEWSGAGAGITLQGATEKSTLTHAWHASYGILALLTLAPLLALNGCDSQGPVDQASEQLNLAVQDMQSVQARPQMNLAPPTTEDGTEMAGPAAAGPLQDNSPQSNADLTKL